MSKLKILSAVILGSSTLLAAQASAFEAGDWVLRAGAVNVAPEETSDNIVSAAAGEVTTAQVSVDDNTQFGISATYMFTENWGIEVLAATPFSHDISGVGTVGPDSIDGAPLASVKHLPPTVSAQYFFLGNESQWQPYVGLGLNYTTFFSEETSATAKSLGYDDISLDDSFGLAASAGVDYMFNDNWGINASIMYAQISTTATLSGATATWDTLTVDYDLDPMVYRLNAVYKF